VNKVVALLLTVLCALTSCAFFSDGNPGRPGNPLVREHPVVPIPLEGEITKRSAEISGLAWYGRDLVLLPQYPERFSVSDDGALFVLSEEDILAYLAGERTEPLAPRRVSFVAPGIRKKIPGYEGYESVAFRGTRVYLTIEAGAGRDMTGYLVTGQVAPNGQAVILDPESLEPIPPQADLSNMSEEALVVDEDRAFTLYEANGEAVNPSPVAHVFREDGGAGTIPFAALEYRVTDATSLDGEGRFWVLNTFFWGDRIKLRPQEDALRAMYGAGPTHEQYHSVERLVEYRFLKDRIERTMRPPIQLTLIDDLHPRNWEGLVRLAPYGFLLATDTYPETLLAFVPAEP
jgi:hypothetical protein